MTAPESHVKTPWCPRKPDVLRRSVPRLSVLVLIACYLCGLASRLQHFDMHLRVKKRGRIACQGDALGGLANSQPAGAERTSEGYGDGQASLGEDRERCCGCHHLIQNSVGFK